jgi:alpha-beta hydrolase superfamily lysophospholipase
VKIMTQDNHSMYVHRWMPTNEKPKALLMIAHGVAEHGKRYSDFAKFLNEKGYAVFAPDHRGHGLSLSPQDTQGFFDSNEGWEKTRGDLLSLVEILQDEYKETPLFILGHSMGSFLVRDLISRVKSPLQGVILSGTSYYSKIFVKVLKLLARREVKIKGERGPSYLLHKMSLGNFNKKFEPADSDNAWLSRDEKQVQLYDGDPLCGFVCTAGYWRDLATGFGNIIDKQNIAKIPSDLPILLYSGDEDPMFKGVTKIYHMYNRMGLNVRLQTNPQGRHESLNEINKEEVYNIFYEFFQSTFN